MKRHAYFPKLSCEHQSGSYCDSCWLAALTRGLSADEWAILHRKAADQPRGTVTRKYAAPKGFAPAKAWNGTAVADIAGAIAASVDENIRHKCDTFQGCGAHGYVVVRTDGRRLLATKTKDEGKPLTALPEMLDVTRYTWADLPAGIDVAVRRVALICQTVDNRKRVPIVSLTLDGADIIVSANNLDGDSASERVAITGHYAPAITVKVNATWLLETLRGPLQLGLQADKLMLRPASDEWRYVQMGYRS